MLTSILWARRAKNKKITSFCGLLCASLPFFPNVAIAQVIPDSSFSAESSVVTPNSVDGHLEEVVAGGATRGQNLFHSFEEFSIPAGQSVYFLNPDGVTRIFSRVTGDLPSDILGTLGVLGSSDLFFINSSGINFGFSAELSIGGSLIASTASAVQFADGVEFWTDLDTTPLLTSAVPASLELLDAPAVNVRNSGREIVNNIFVDNLSSRTGLAVLPTETLALIGGDVNLYGGILRTPGGNIEIGSVEQGVVKLLTSDSGFDFSYEGVTLFGEINLSQLSLIEGSGSPIGQVNLTGHDVSVRDGSLVFLRNFGDGLPGNIEINALESIEIGLSDRPEPLVSGLYSENFGGKGADIFLDALRVSVLNAGQVVTNNYVPGLSGNIFIDAQDSILIDGFYSTSESLFTFVTSNGRNQSDSGFVRLNAGDVRISNGAQFGTIAGNGSPGDVEVSARNIVVEGSLPTSLKPSVLGIISGGTGNSSQLSIETETLQVLNGGAVGSISLSTGDGGDTIIRAEDFVLVEGSFPGAVNPSIIDSSVALINPITLAFIRVQPTPTSDGRAGNVLIETPRLFLRDGGAIRVQNGGRGDAGTLSIDAEQIQMRSGRISAITRGGDGGSIEISANSLLAIEESTISATAGIGGQGGNITIDSEAIALSSGSSIAANADRGEGGQITVITDTLLRSPDSSITATSAAGPELAGVVDIQAPDETPQTDSEITTDVIAVSDVAVACSGGAGESEFIITGRGGLPRSPSSIQQSYGGWRSPSSSAANTDLNRTQQVTQAQGWVFNGDGTVSLTAQVPNPANSARRTACVSESAQNRS